MKMNAKFVRDETSGGTDAMTTKNPKSSGNRKQDSIRDQSDKQPAPITPVDEGDDPTDKGDILPSNRTDGGGTPTGKSLDCPNDPGSNIDNAECKLTAYLKWCPYTDGRCNDYYKECQVGTILAIDYGFAAIDNEKILDVKYFCSGELECGINEDTIPINTGVGSHVFMKITNCSEPCDYIGFTAEGKNVSSSGEESSCSARETVAFPFQVEQFILL
jgi:hypothetical protein